MKFSKIADAIYNIKNDTCVAVFTKLNNLPIPNTPKVKPKNLNELRIMTYNIKNAYSVKDVQLRYARIIKLCEQINDYEPDIMGIQEADAPWMGEDETGDINASFPVCLNKYAFVGQSRQDPTGEWAPIFYLKDKFELIDSGTFWLSDTPNTASKTWDSGHNRICTWAVLQNIKTKQQFTHFNTHFDLSEISRQKSIDVVLKKVKTAQTPVILSGDFNLHQGSSIYKKVLKNGFDDSKKIAKSKINFCTLNLYRYTNVRFFPIADFMFFSKNDFSISKYQIDNNYLFDNNYISDHFPVIVDFKFK